MAQRVDQRMEETSPSENSPCPRTDLSELRMSRRFRGRSKTGRMRSMSHYSTHDRLVQRRCGPNLRVHIPMLPVCMRCEEGDFQDFLVVIVDFLNFRSSPLCWGGFYFFFLQFYVRRRRASAKAEEWKCWRCSESDSCDRVSWWKQRFSPPGP